MCPLEMHVHFGTKQLYAARDDIGAGKETLRGVHSSLMEGRVIPRVLTTLYLYLRTLGQLKRFSCPSIRCLTYIITRPPFTISSCHPHAPFRSKILKVAHITATGGERFVRITKKPNCRCARASRISDELSG